MSLFIRHRGLTVSEIGQNRAKMEIFGRFGPLYFPTSSPIEPPKPNTEKCIKSQHIHIKQNI